MLLHQDICLVHPLTYVQLHLSAFAPKLLFWLQVHLMAIELRELVLAPAMHHSLCDPAPLLLIWGFSIRCIPLLFHLRLVRFFPSLCVSLFSGFSLLLFFWGGGDYFWVLLSQVCTFPGKFHIASIRDEAL